MDRIRLPASGWLWLLGHLCFLQFVAILQARPGADWVEGAGYRTAELAPIAGGKPGFTLMAPGSTGLAFTNVLAGDAYLTNFVAHNGAGVAIGDVDGDGWQDIYLCTLQGTNRLFRNLGEWRFAELDAGPAHCVGQFSTAACFADVDGDGDLDLVVNGIARGSRLFLNDGKGHFSESTESGLSKTASATSMAFADMDGDGDLDLYCTHYIDVMHLADPTTRFGMAKREGQWVVTKVNDVSTASGRLKDRFEALPDGSVRELPEAHALYRNDGKGHFTAVEAEKGVFLDAAGRPVGPYRDWGLAVQFRDLNGDGHPDLYVCNDNASPDRLWINSGTGTFRAVESARLRHTSRSSMGADVADVDRDGHFDILVVDMLARDHAKRMTQLVRDRGSSGDHERATVQTRYNRNTLQMGRPGGAFVDTALMAGVAASDWSWCPMFVDVDLDGYEDLLVTNGFSFDVMDQDSHDSMRARQRQMTFEQRKRSRQLHPRWPTRNAVFRNRGDGTFDPVPGGWGFDQEGISYGAALGDLDNDGDLDVVVNNLNAPASLFRNDSTAPRIAVRLVGLGGNSQGVGAKITLEGGTVRQSQEITAGGRYLSCDQATRTFAAVSGESRPMRLNVRWRNGRESTVSNVVANRVYEVRETPLAPLSGAVATARPAPLFEDWTSSLGSAVEAVPFDEFARQPLLPRALGRDGPGVGWIDVDGDGWEDLIVGEGRHGRLRFLQSKGGQRFVPQVLATNLPGEVGAVLRWHDGQGHRRWLGAVSNYKAASGSHSVVAIGGGRPAEAMQVLDVGLAGAGPITTGDFDGDGDLDLFVGARSVPGRYPESTNSLVGWNDGGRLVPGTGDARVFGNAGLVTGAASGDIDGDGVSDLVLATEWGPVRIYSFRQGRWVETTEEFGLPAVRGWWSSVVLGDFDGDGRLDIAAGNLGRNSMRALFRSPAFRLYFGDLAGDGGVQCVEAWSRGDGWFPVLDRTQLSRGIPELVSRFPTHEKYAQAALGDVLGSASAHATFIEATLPDSTVFLNRGRRFEAIPLPLEAQLAPVRSLVVADADGDGFEDLFLAQNDFGSVGDLNRDDGGRGLWLRGLGDGHFVPIDALASGISIQGEQRGTAVADFNHDGRVDLVVAEYNGETRLFANRGGKKGLRVELAGPASNPEGVGALIRVDYGEGRLGPARSVSGGSGMGSHDSAINVLGFRETPKAIRVRWAGGKDQTVDLAPGQESVRIAHNPKP